MKIKSASIILGFLITVNGLSQLPIKGPRRYAPPSVPTETLSAGSSIVFDRNENHLIHLSLVFHFIHEKSGSGLSREEAQWQIEALNNHFGLEEFRAKRQKYGPNIYDSLAVDTEIRFCLHSIINVPTDSPYFRDYRSFLDNALPMSPPHQSTKFINIWIGQFEGKSGYAFDSDTYSDGGGILIDVDYFALGHPPYDEGKTLTHLLANFMGILPIWGAKYCAGDGIEDTPLHNAPNDGGISTADHHISLCDGFEREMYMNFMDNTEDSLLYMFTDGEKQQMMQYLYSQRNELIHNSCRSVQKVPDSQHPERYMSVSPSLTSQTITLHCTSHASLTSKVFIFNEFGRVVYQRDFKNDLHARIDVGAWACGMYFVRFAEGYTTLKFLKI